MSLKRIKIPPIDIDHSPNLSPIKPATPTPIKVCTIKL